MLDAAKSRLSSVRKITAAATVCSGSLWSLLASPDKGRSVPLRPTDGLARASGLRWLLKAGALVQGLPERLRATAALVGCADRKGLCSAFLRVNPSSDFERSHTCVQWCALPRSARVNLDRAVLVEVETRSPFWLTSCSLPEFVRALLPVPTKLRSLVAPPSP